MNSRLGIFFPILRPTNVDRTMAKTDRSMSVQLVLVGRGRFFGDECSPLAIIPVGYERKGWKSFWTMLRTFSILLAENQALKLEMTRNMAVGWGKESERLVKEISHGVQRKSYDSAVMESRLEVVMSGNSRDEVFPVGVVKHRLHCMIDSGLEKLKKY